MKLENRFTVPVSVPEAWAVLLDVERIAPCMPGATLTERSGDTFSGKVKVKVGPINLTYGGKARFVSLDEDAHVAVLEGTGKETRGTGTAKALVTCRLHDRGGSTEVEVDTDLAVTGKPASFGRGVLADVSGKLVGQFAACLSEEILSGTPTPVASEATTAAVATTPANGDSAATTDAAATTGPIATSPPSVPEAAAGAGTCTPPVAPAPAAAAATATPAAPPTPAPSAAPATAVPRPLRKPAEPIDLLGTAGAPVAKRLVPLLAGAALLLLVVRRLLR